MAVPPYFPIFILALAIAVIVAAYILSFQSGVLDCMGGRFVTPAISLLMFDGPGRVLGQIGFPTISVLFAACVLPLKRGLEQAHRNAKLPVPNLTMVLGSACVAFLGLAVVGAIPLQQDVCAVMAGRTPLRNESIVHQSAAAIFFAASAVHMFTWLSLMANVRRECIISRASRPFSFWLKSACFVFSWLPLPTAFALHPASPVRTQLKLTEADAGGLQQYVLVACVSSFFASYSIELAAFAALEKCPQPMAGAATQLKRD